MSTPLSDLERIAVFHVPGLPLSDFVACCWYVVGPAPVSPMERVLPDGAVQLIFSLRGNGFRVYDPAGAAVAHRLPGAIVTGPSARYAIIDARDTAATVGVSFRPGNAAPFVGVPPSEFTGQDLDVETTWGRTVVDRLHTRLAEATSPADAFVRLEAALLERLSTRLLTPPRVRHALDVFTRTAHVASVGEVHEAVGLSHRRFLEVFTRSVGLTPKVFCRVQRFQRVVRLAHRRRDIRWADVAHACDYSDQSHLTRDFRAFSGLTPSEWAASRTAFHNHVRV